MSTTMEIKSGNRIVRIDGRMNAGAALFVARCFVVTVGGDVAISSKNYKTLKGAEKFAHGWCK